MSNAVCNRYHVSIVLQANHKEVLILYVPCYTEIIMNMFPFIETLRISRVSNLKGIKFRGLLYSSHFLAPPFMTPVSKLDVRGNIFIIIPIFFVCSFFCRLLSKFYLVRTLAPGQVSSSSLCIVARPVHNRELQLVTLPEFVGRF